ncbi:hypothetical protein ACGFWI_37585 [Streptomyces sp. NPDC048434]|uniref:hypothetical protein n=1 Tax=Streptomyces sp. NPDC048434 TaxID=3365549 RepID=UPI003717CE04
MPNEVLGLGGGTLAAVNDRLPHGAGGRLVHVGADAPYTSATAVMTWPGPRRHT